MWHFHCFCIFFPWWTRIAFFCVNEIECAKEKSLIHKVKNKMWLDDGVRKWKVFSKFDCTVSHYFRWQPFMVRMKFIIKIKKFGKLFSLYLYMRSFCEDDCRIVIDRLVDFKSFANKRIDALFFQVIVDFRFCSIKFENGTPF